MIRPRYSLAAAAALTFALLGSSRATPQNAPPPFPVPPPLNAPLPFVSPIFGDNMVLQRGKPDTIWGWSQPGDTVQVQIGDHRATGTAGPDHRWQVRIEPPPAGGPYTVTISGPQTVTLHNVLVGDVWLCGGQSNMELPLRFTANAEEVAKAANDPEIRYFTVAGRPAYHPTELIGGSWKVVSPQTADWLSAVAFYFGRKLQEKTHIPIGLVVDAVGGTPAEAWTSAAALRPMGDFNVPLDELQHLADSGAPAYGNYIMHWYDEYDIGLKEKWFAPDLKDADWKSVHVPGGFAELGVPDAPAVVWFRREITLPNPLPAGRATIHLGEIERMDTVYVNGTDVGGSAWVENPRVYSLRPGVLKPGQNLIAIRVFKTKPDGGFLGKPDELHLALGEQNIPLAGEWKARLSVDARPPHPMPTGFENWPVIPTVLYQGMLKPIVPLSITGAIWYQGEQNSPRGYQYRRLLPVMIADWRRTFEQGDFPFYIVSLPAFGPRSPAPTDDAWAETRESQAVAAATVPNACLAVTIDTGDADSLHPKEKEPVGDRLADCALAKYYHQHVVDSGPTLQSVQRKSGSIVLHFANTNGGLVAKGGKLGEFSIAGNDRKWYWARARIKGRSVIVSSPSVPHPAQVRYAWQSNPEATLFNGAGLPAAPFRTDDWPGITQNARPY
ncbi:MAG: sialate O-acetylesterase [Acidobacteriota bacterium]